VKIRRVCWYGVSSPRLYQPIGALEQRQAEDAGDDEVEVRGAGRVDEVAENVSHEGKRKW
jgi:hypothetical protein